MRSRWNWNNVRRRENKAPNTAQLSLDFEATKKRLETSERHLAAVRSEAKEAEKRARDAEIHNAQLTAQLRAILANDRVVKILNGEAPETPRAKRGRPSNAELAARAAKRLNSAKGARHG